MWLVFPCPWNLKLCWITVQWSDLFDHAWPVCYYSSSVLFWNGWGQKHTITYPSCFLGEKRQGKNLLCLIIQVKWHRTYVHTCVGLLWSIYSATISRLDLCAFTNQLIFTLFVFFTFTDKILLNEWVHKSIGHLCKLYLHWRLFLLN